MILTESRNHLSNQIDGINAFFTLLRNLLITITFVVAAVVSTLVALSVGSFYFYVLAACSTILAFACCICLVLNMAHIAFDLFTNNSLPRFIIGFVIMFAFIGGVATSIVLNPVVQNYLEKAGGSQQSSPQK